MGAFLRWFLVMTLQIGFWASVVITFFPILTIVVAGITTAVNGTVLADLYAITQIWLPFNFNVVMLWVLTGASAFGTYWISVKLYNLLRGLIHV